MGRKTVNYFGILIRRQQEMVRMKVDCKKKRPKPLSSHPSGLQFLIYGKVTVKFTTTNLF